MKLLTENDPAIDVLFGGISPPDAMNLGGSGTPQQGLGNLIGFGIRMFIMLAGFSLLIYLLWGAFDWISSGGEKEKITKAQNKITNAVIGIVLVFVVLMVFNLLAGDVLKIIIPDPNGNGFIINFPTLGE
ncbi:MAG: hypothetical protein AAB788_00820 [Patescibacteria group bacterium]